MYRVIDNTVDYVFVHNDRDNCVAEFDKQEIYLLTKFVSVIGVLPSGKIEVAISLRAKSNYKRYTYLCNICGEHSLLITEPSAVDARIARGHLILETTDIDKICNPLYTLTDRVLAIVSDTGVLIYLDTLDNETFVLSRICKSVRDARFGGPTGVDLVVDDKIVEFGNITSYHPGIFLHIKANCSKAVKDSVSKLNKKLIIELENDIV